jgi:predicted nucleic acid-binding protein
VANSFYLDASALVKRYISEPGTAVINYLFQATPWPGMICLTVGMLEVISILVRKRNALSIPLAAFSQALTDFRKEVMDHPGVAKVTVRDALVNAAIPLIPAHSLNATDAVVLRSALDLANPLRAIGDDLVLVASDQRLLKAAQAEGLTTFDPENQSITDLDALLQP